MFLFPHCFRSLKRSTCVHYGYIFCIKKYGFSRADEIWEHTCALIRRVVWCVLWLWCLVIVLLWGRFTILTGVYCLLRCLLLFCTTIMGWLFCQQLLYNSQQFRTAHASALHIFHLNLNPSHHLIKLIYHICTCIHREATTATKSDVGIADQGDGAGKKKRGSRNKKKNMRKVDISDVDKAQESARHDERTGYVCTSGTLLSWFFIMVHIYILDKTLSWQIFMYFF